MTNYFQAIQTAVLYKENSFEMFKRYVIMFLDLRGCLDQKKM